MSSASPRVTFITGANTGLGFEILKSLCRSQRPYTVYAGSRDIPKGEAALEELKKEYPSTHSTFIPIQVDLESDESIEKAVNTVADKEKRIDVLVNNGGASFDGAQQSGHISLRESFNKAWDVNVSGTQVLTTLAVPWLLKSDDARLIFMTSGTASLGETERQDNSMYQRLNGSPAKGWPKEKTFSATAYRSSKTGLNMVMREWVRILGNDDVKIWCISPGFLATNLNGATPDALKKVFSPRQGLLASVLMSCSL